MLEITGIEETLAMLAKEARAPRKLGAAAKRMLQRAVDRERSGHAYENRTHSAETNTLLLQVGSGDDVDLRVEMAVPYASYLQDRNGKKWSRFDDLVRAALGEIDSEARKL